jgi:hypothetical protein
MCFTIEFDREQQFWREEIDDVFVEWFLSVKIDAEKLAPFESIPEQHLAECAMLPQFARESPKARVVAEVHVALLAIQPALRKSTHTGAPRHPSREGIRRPLARDNLAGGVVLGASSFRLTHESWRSARQAL